MNACAIPPRPLLRYLGSKFRQAPAIVAQLPPHEIYLEAYGGSAAVLAHKARSDQEIWNDLDGEVVNLFRVLRSARAGELVDGVDLTPYARAEHTASYAPAEDPVEAARRLLVRSHQGHGNNGTLKTNLNGWRRDGLKAGTDVARNWAEFPGALELWIERLKRVQIEARPALDLIRKYAHARTLMYLDPPYVPETRSQSVRWTTGKCCYAHEMSVEDHAELLETLAASPAMVVLSGYPSALYDQALQGWQRVEMAARAMGNKPRTEVLWSNPAAVDALAAAGRSQPERLFA